MAEITAALVGKLREMTNAGLMDCKKALGEVNGDLNAAVDILRKKGVATAAKKAGREAKEGVIAHYIAPGSKLGVLVDVTPPGDDLRHDLLDATRGILRERGRRPASRRLRKYRGRSHRNEQH